LWCYYLKPMHKGLCSCIEYLSFDWTFEIHHEKSLVSKQITISLGITVYRGEANIDQQELLSYADQALYRAKNWS
jgi:PleD family two-component response regulator